MRFITFLMLISSVAALTGSRSEAEVMEESADDSLGALHRAQSVYRDTYIQVCSESAGELDELGGAYVKAVRRFREKLLKAGKLDELLVVRQELERFDREDTVKESDFVSSPNELLNLQKVYQRRAERLIRDKHRRILSLTKKYINFLERMQKDLTRQRRIEDALAVKTEIEAVKRDPGVLEAESFVEKTKAAGSEEAVASDSDVSEDGVKASPGVVVSTDPGQMRPNDSSFKSVSFRRTDMSSVTHPVWCRAWIAVDRQKNTRTTDWTGSYSGSSEVQHRLKLVLKTRDSGESLKDQIVVIQYFTEGVKKSDKPRQAGCEYCVLDVLDSNGVLLECPPFRTKRDIRTEYSGEAHRLKSEGTQFSGFTVSVFDKDRNITYQKTSAADLRDLGRTATRALERILQQINAGEQDAEPE